jgi:hypothetical protein
VLPDLGRGPVGHMVFELVDAVVETVDHRQEPLGDLVDDHVETQARRGAVA